MCSYRQYFNKQRLDLFAIFKRQGENGWGTEEKGTEEKVAYCDSLSNSRQSEESLPCGSFPSPWKLELFSIYLDLSRGTRYFFGLVSVFPGLFRHLVIRSPTSECILNYLMASIGTRLSLGPIDQIEKNVIESYTHPLKIWPCATTGWVNKRPDVWKTTALWVYKQWYFAMRDWIVKYVKSFLESFLAEIGHSVQTVQEILWKKSLWETLKCAKSTSKLPWCVSLTPMTSERLSKCYPLGGWKRFSPSMNNFFRGIPFS